MEVNPRLFQTNVELWRHSCPREATLLAFMEGTPAGKLHKKASLQVLEKWMQSLPLKDVELVIVYGVGVGECYEALHRWLKGNEKRHLVFFEDDIYAIKTLFEHPVGKEILEDAQVRLLYFDNLRETNTTFDAFYWNFALTPFVVTAIKPKLNTETFEELHHKIAYDMAVRNALLDEYLNYGAGFYTNFYQNLLQLPKSCLGTRLFGKFKNVPAIICGAGPSLAKNIRHLSTLLDRALVFAGGSSLNALNSAGFNPHFGAGIDPNPAQLERLMSNKAEGVPFFYRNRLYHPAFMAIRGAKLYIPGAGGYDTADFFDEKLKIKGKGESIDEGHNVVNFCAEIAHAMGCNPIVFVGMDLSYTGMKQYAPGVIQDPSTSKKHLSKVESNDALPILKKDIFGKPTHTLWKWVAESEWISGFAKNHPHITVINCTEGGLGFPDVPNRPLAKVSATLMKRRYPLHEQLNRQIKRAVLHHVKRDKVNRLMEELRKSLVSIVEDFKILKEETERSIQKVRGGQLELTQSGRAALIETELVEKIGYTTVLEIFNEIYARILSREGHALTLRRLSKKEKVIGKLKIALKKYAFLQNVAKINADIIAYSKKLARKKRI